MAALRKRLELCGKWQKCSTNKLRKMTEMIKLYVLYPVIVT